jgi:hypothetical protein
VYFLWSIICYIFIFDGSIFFRYRVKVNVEDATGQAVFVLFELDMYNLIDKKCAELYLNDRVSVTFQLNVLLFFR